jgi:ADP-ribose pyrophosphatase YjhB (NUDIX family)
MDASKATPAPVKLPRYASSLEEAATLAASTGKPKLTQNVYGTVLLIPASGAYKIDFGLAKWPPADIKKEVCCRVLLVSTWTDNRWGFAGGGVAYGEDPLDAMNREFLEETGSTSTTFEKGDYCFSHVKPDGSSTHVFCKRTTDLAHFQSILTDFHSKSERTAYVDEVIGICGMPLWIEGPELCSQVDTGKNSVWGLPRLLVGNGGSFTQGIFLKVHTGLAREQFLLVLIKHKVLTEALLERIVELSKAFPLGPPLLSCADLLSLPGVREVLNN